MHTPRSRAFSAASPPPCSALFLGHPAASLVALAASRSSILSPQSTTAFQRRPLPPTTSRRRPSRRLRSCIPILHCTSLTRPRRRPPQPPTLAFPTPALRPRFSQPFLVGFVDETTLRRNRTGSFRPPIKTQHSIARLHRCANVPFPTTSVFDSHRPSASGNRLLLPLIYPLPSVHHLAVSREITVKMVFIDKVMVEIMNVAARGLDGTQSSTTVGSTSSTSAASSPTTTPGNSSNSNTSQSPLLFFVALGFGVVFTNLWIIVGVKYCFRYNARNRALARGEDGEPINLENMPRPHRRRREKKLMTMDEVNERFPITKYKNWMATRAEEGLSTAGGVAAVPGSRPASLRNVDGIMPTSPIALKHSEDRPATAGSTMGTPEVTASPATNALGGTVGVEARNSTGTTAEEKVKNSPAMANLTEVETSAITERKSEEDEDEDNHIHDALPPEMVANPGDTCAICIDTLEPDDDIRGLTCGHAFHAGCLDPWLTSRRACCPLCKADYFVPKPRPEGEVAEPERPRRGTAGRMNLPAQPRSAWIGVRGPRGMMLPGRFMTASAPDGPSQRPRRQRTAAELTTLEPQDTAATSATGETTTLAPRAFASRIPNPFSNMHMPAMRLPGRRLQEETSVGAAEPTPGQLESGGMR